MIGTAAQRRAISGLAASPDAVIVFGVLGTLLLVAGYAPIRATLYTMGDAAIDGAVGEAPGTTAEVEAWTKRRAALEQLVGQDPSMLGLSGIVTTLLPLVVAATNQLLAR